MSAASRWAALRAAAQLASTVALGDFTAEDDAELSFAKGESLTVLPVVPPEGWLVAKRDDGAQGLVPEGYLAEPSETPAPSADGRLVAQALGTFTGEDATELSFREGDVLTILPEPSPEGWLYAENSAGTRGLVPATYVGTTGPAPTAAAPAPAPTLASAMAAAESPRDEYGDDEFEVDEALPPGLVGSAQAAGSGYGDDEFDDEFNEFETSPRSDAPAPPPGASYAEAAATQSTPSLVSRGDAAASSSHDASSPSLPPLSSASPRSPFDPAAAPTFGWVPPLPPATPPRSKKRRVKRRSDGRAKAWKEAQAFNGRPVTLPPVRNGATAAGSPRTSPRGSQERRPKASPYESALAPPKLSSQQLSTTLRNYWAARPLSPTPTKATPPKMKVYHVVYY